MGASIGHKGGILYQTECEITVVLTLTVFIGIA